MSGRKSSHHAGREAALEVVRTLRAHGHAAYFAGGCVRDELLGRVPDDYDVATDAVPGRVAELFPRTEMVGAAFGVVLVKGRTSAVEVATFRSDGAYGDQRRPDAVVFSTPEADAHRRDFTVNAMFLDPLAERGEGVVDYVGGRADLRAKVLRAVGDARARLREDHLRALRAVRLSAKLGFSIEAGTAEAIRRHARELAGVSRERVGDEMRAMLTHDSRAAALGGLHALGLAGVVLEGVGLREGVSAFPVVAGLGAADASFGVVLAAWMFDACVRAPGEAEVAKARSALCLSNEETRVARDAVVLGQELAAVWGGLGVAGKKRLAGSAGFANGMAIVRVREPGAAGEIAAEVARLAGEHGGLTPERLVDGDALVAAGFAPGKVFKRVLEAVYDAQLEGRVRSRAEGMAMAREMMGRVG